MIKLILRGLKGSHPFRVEYDNSGATVELAKAVQSKISTRPTGSTPVVMCIGTDRSTGDALGPLVGTELLLRQPNLHVYGSLDEPVHAVNLAEVIQTVSERFSNPYVIAIDACLGQLSSVGHITLSDGALQPGAGVHKKLPPVGDLHITGIVNVGGFMEYFVLQNTRLSIVFKMANVIAQALAVGIQVSEDVDTSTSVGSPTAIAPMSRLGSLFKNRVGGGM